MKYRKKPITIEAKQFFIEDWLKAGEPKPVYKKRIPSQGIVKYQLYIDTLEGRHEVTGGDWIITGIKGEKYPVKDEIFKLTYEKVKE